MNTTNLTKLIAWFFLALLIISTASAIGVSPGKRVIDYNDGSTANEKITIHNTDGVAMQVLLEPKGELAEYITLEQNELTFAANEDKKSVGYTLKMPPGLSPGLHSAEITAKELLEELDSSTIRPSLMVGSLVYIKVPYPGKYISANLYIPEGTLGQDMKMSVAINHLGNNPIEELKAKVQIYNPQGELMSMVSSEKISLEPKEVRELIIELNTLAYDPGEYQVHVTIEYDGETMTISDQLRIDDFLLKLLSVAVRDFELGDIANFDLTIKNIGNLLVEKAYAELVLKSATRTLADLTSYKVDIDALETKSTNIYWDTSDVAQGTYEGTLSLRYKDQSLTKDIITTVGEDSIDISFGPTGMVVEQPSATGTDMGLVPYLIVIIILLIVIMVVVLRKNKAPAEEVKKK